MSRDYAESEAAPPAARLGGGRDHAALEGEAERAALAIGARGAAPPLTAAGPSVQRLGLDDLVAAGDAVLGFSRVIVDDGTLPAAGQLTRTQFLAELARIVRAGADPELATVGRSTAACSFIQRWLDHYRDVEASRLERAARLYTLTRPAAATDLLDAIRDRVGRAVRTWIDSGQITGLPGFGAADLAEPADAAPVARLAADGGGEAPSASPSAIEARLGPGRPLDAGVRTRMEHAFATSFDDVRVHTDPGASRLASELQARAFTVGHNVAFGAGELRPGTRRGDGMIAHELAHVVQQRGGTAATTAHPEHDADAAVRAAALREHDADAPAPAPAATGLALHKCSGEDPPDSPVLTADEIAEERADNAGTVRTLTTALHDELAARATTVADATLSGPDLADRLDRHDAEITRLRDELSRAGVRVTDSTDPERDLLTRVSADTVPDLTAPNPRLELSCGDTASWGDEVAMRIRLDYVPPDTPVEVEWRWSTTSNGNQERLLAIHGWDPFVGLRNTQTDVTLDAGFWEDGRVMGPLRAAAGVVTFTAHVYYGRDTTAIDTLRRTVTFTTEASIPDTITLAVRGGAVPAGANHVIAAQGAELQFEPSWIPPRHLYVPHWWWRDLHDHGNDHELLQFLGALPDTAAIGMRFPDLGDFAISMETAMRIGGDPFGYTVVSGIPADAELPPAAAVRVEVKSAEDFGDLVLDRIEASPIPRPGLAEYLTGLDDQEAASRRLAGRGGAEHAVYEQRADALWRISHDLERRVPGARGALPMPSTDEEMETIGGVFSAPVTAALVLPENQGAQPLNLYLTLRRDDVDAGGLPVCGGWTATLVDGTSPDAWSFTGTGLSPDAAAQAAFVDMAAVNPYPVGGHVHYRFRREGWAPIEGSFETTTFEKEAIEWIEGILQVLGFVAAALLLMLPDATITKWLGAGLLVASIGLSVYHLARNAELGLPWLDSRNVLEGLSILATAVGLGGSLQRGTAIAGLRAGVARPAMFRWGNRLIMTSAALDVGTFVYTTSDALEQLQAALADPNQSDDDRVRLFIRTTMSLVLNGAMLFAGNRELFEGGFRASDYFGTVLPRDLPTGSITMDLGTRMDVMAALRRSGWTPDQLRTMGADALFSHYTSLVQLRGEVDGARVTEALGRITSPDLRELVLTDPRVWRALHNEDYNPQALEAAWTAYNAPRTSSRALRSGSFGEYLQNHSGYRTTLGGPSVLLADAFPGWATMTVRERQGALLARAEPALAAGLEPGSTVLPATVKSAIEGVLGADHVGRSTTLDGARGNLMSEINAALGRAITTPDELAAVLRVIGSSGNVGSIGEHFAQHQLTDPAHVDTDLVHERFTPDEVPGLTVNPFLPDRVVTAAGRTVDIKTGYARSQIDLAQARNYEALRAASRTDPAVAARVGGGPLSEHVWLFLPGGDAPAATVAARERRRLTEAGFRTQEVWYLGPDGSIYRVVTNTTPDVSLGTTIHAALGL